MRMDPKTARILEDFGLFIREATTTIVDLVKEVSEIKSHVRENRDDWRQVAERVDSLSQRAAAIEALLRREESGGSQAITAFGKLPGRAQALILAAAALLAASGWLSRLLG